jgi:hypothetical protein
MDYRKIITIGFLIESRDCGTGQLPAEAERARVHTMLVIGGRDVEEVIADILEKIHTRAA